MNKTIEVLLSCMHQPDTSIVSRSNIQCNVVVVNQTDYDERSIIPFKNKDSQDSLIKFLSTTERGLSKSRNMAIKNSTADFCLICDDDEILVDDCSNIICKAFEENPTADVIAFKIEGTGKNYCGRKKNINYISALQLASWQLAFRRNKIVENNILFDETLGSGVSKAGGEENMFIYDCLKRNLNVIYLPLTIGRMIEGQSQWFVGCNKAFFYDRGVMTRKLMGKIYASLYAVYYLVSKHHWYKKDISLLNATKSIFKGLYT